MTGALPRSLPEAGAMQHSFEPQRVDYLSPEGGARLGAVSAGWPLWYFATDLNNMSPDDADIWRAFTQARRGSQRWVYGRDFSRDVPKYHAGGIPFTISPSGWSQALDDEGNAILTLEGCMPGMVLSLVDYVGFVWDDWKRSLVRVVEGGVAQADGTLVVTVEPPVPAVTPSDATVNLNKPDCLMRIVTDTTKLGVQMYGGMWTAAGGRIEAVQDLVA